MFNLENTFLYKSIPFLQLPLFEFTTDLGHKQCIQFLDFIPNSGHLHGPTSEVPAKNEGHQIKTTSVYIKIPQAQCWLPGWLGEQH